MLCVAGEPDSHEEPAASNGEEDTWDDFALGIMMRQMVQPPRPRRRRMEIVDLTV